VGIPSGLARLNPRWRSTAGCGKPHVRWCGSPGGRNPARATRSLLAWVEAKGDVFATGTEGAGAITGSAATKASAGPLSAVARQPRGEGDCADAEVAGHLRPRPSCLLVQADGVELVCLVVALTGGGCAPVPGRRLHVVKFGVYAFRVQNIPAHSNRPRNPSNPDPEDFDQPPTWKAPEIHVDGGCPCSDRLKKFSENNSLDLVWSLPYRKEKSYFLSSYLNLIK